MAFPDNRSDLEQMGYSYNGDGRCRGCGADLLWFDTPRGKKMPFSRIADQGPADNEEKLEAHWGVCTERERFKK